MRTSCDIPNRLWERAKQECIDRRVSLNKLIEFGLRLALRDDDIILVKSDGKIENDLKGFLTPK